MYCHLIGIMCSIVLFILSSYRNGSVSTCHIQILWNTLSSNTEPVVKNFSVAIDQLYEILLPHEPTGLAVNVKFVLTFILCVAGLAVMETVGGGVDVS